MDKDTLDKANKLTEIIGIHTRVLARLKNINADDNIIVISSSHELYDNVKNVIQEHDKLNPDHVQSIEIGGGPKDYMLKTMIDYEDTAIIETSAKLEAL